MPSSKRLGHDDSSGFAFAKEMLAGDVTAAINFDRLQYHPEQGYIIFEYLLCDEEQHVTPFTSHPNNYWSKNRMKFIRLWKAAEALHATLYLVNYAKKGTHAEDEILLIQVKDMDETGIHDETTTRYTRAEFAAWFRALNRACLEDPASALRCPHCGAAIRQGENGYYCPERCGMAINRLYGVQLSAEVTKQLLLGTQAAYTNTKGQACLALPEVVAHEYEGKTYYHWKSRILRDGE